MFALLATTTMTTTDTPSCMQILTVDESQLQHRGYGHLNYKGLRTLEHKSMIQEFPELKGVKSTCTNFLVGKQHRETISKKSL